MLYNTLKILHIISASLLLVGIVQNFLLWLGTNNRMTHIFASQKIQRQTWTMFIPFVIFQLATGFTMISVRQYDLSEFWIVGSISGFIVLIASWFSFLYLLLTSSQTKKKLQVMMLIISGITLLFMIFLMVNKIT